MKIEVDSATSERLFQEFLFHFVSCFPIHQLLFYNIDGVIFERNNFLTINTRKLVILLCVSIDTIRTIW